MLRQNKTRQQATATRPPLALSESLIALGFVGYMCLLIVGIGGERTDYSVLDDSVGIFQRIGVMIFVGVTALFAPHLRRSEGFLNTPGVRWLLLFFGLCVLFSFWSVAPIQSALYAAVTGAICYALYCFSKIDQRLVTFATLCVSVFYLLYAVLNLYLFGIGTGRFVGTIGPSHFASIALVPALLICTLSGRYRWVFYFAGVALAAMVNSRGVILAFAIIGAGYALYRLYNWRGGAGLMAVLSFVVLASIAGAVAIGRERLQDVLVEGMLRLDDATRGVGSGGSGRVDRWREGLAVFAEHPVVGIGFRGSRLEFGHRVSHSAYIDLLKETGIVGFVVFLVCLLRIGYYKWSVAWAMTARGAQKMLEWLALGALMILAALEVHMVNIGFPLGVCFLLLAVADFRADESAPNMAQSNRGPSI